MLKFLSSVFKNVGKGGEVHNAVLNALDKAMEDLNEVSDQLKKELAIDTASGEWLDKWGEWFGVSRKAGESDGEYRERILGVLQYEKITIPAIIFYVKKILGEDTVVTIYEPYVDLRIFNRSSFSKQGKFPDGVYNRTAVVDIIISKPLTKELEFLLNLIRAAGVRIYFTHRPLIETDGGVVDLTSDEMVLPDTICRREMKFIEIPGTFNVKGKHYLSGEQIIWDATVSQPV